MAGSTPIYGLPYPEPSDLVANYPALGESLAETLDEKLPTYAATAPTSPSVGQIWVDSDDDKGYVWNGAAWVTFSAGVAAAVISDTPTGNYTDGGGVVWNYWQYTSSGSLTCTTAGQVEVLIVGGGGGPGSSGGIVGGGGAGGLVASTIELTAATHTITIGAGGASGSNIGAQGGKTSLGTLAAAGGGGAGLGASNGVGNIFPTWGHAGGYAGGIVIFSSAAGRAGMGSNALGANEYSGTSSAITGTSTTYAEGGNSGVPTTKGSGGWSGAGVDGILIVRARA